MAKSNGVIYVLCDPRTGARRVVGMSRKPDATVDVGARYSRARRDYRNESRTDGEIDSTLYDGDRFIDTAQSHWLRTLPERPSIEVLERDVPVSKLKTRRRAWVATLKADGAALLNSYPGGKRGAQRLT